MERKARKARKEPRSNMGINREKWREEILPRLIPEMRNLDHGFTVTDGWRDLVCDLVDQLDLLQVPYEILQIKEKFGGLRFYTQAKDAPEEFRALVAKAEAASLSICEDCGAAGERRGDGWIRTLCKPCDVKFLERRAARFSKYAQ